MGRFVTAFGTGVDAIFAAITPPPIKRWWRNLDTGSQLEIIQFAPMYVMGVLATIFIGYELATGDTTVAGLWSRMNQVARPAAILVIAAIAAVVNIEGLMIRELDPIQRLLATYYRGAVTGAALALIFVLLFH